MIDAEIEEWTVTSSVWHGLSQGASPPRLTFGIGHAVVRLIKGILVTVDATSTSGQPSLVTHQVGPDVAEHAVMAPVSKLRQQRWRLL